MTFKDLARQLQRLQKEPVSKETVSEIAQATRDEVKARTQKGFGVNTPKGPKTRLKKLSSGYVKQRRGLKKKGILGGAATVQKSNVSKTGAMLDSMKYSASENEIRIYISGQENVAKAVDLDSQGRVFMNLSKTEFNKVKRAIEDSIRKKIKRILG